MKTQHTPGPWKALGSQDLSEIVQPAKNGGPSKLIAGTYYSPFDESVCQANVRLIAAAPELLGALEVIVRAFDSDPFGRIGVAIVNDARAAITKAKGE